VLPRRERGGERFVRGVGAQQRLKRVHEWTDGELGDQPNQIGRSPRWVAPVLMADCWRDSEAASRDPGSMLPLVMASRT
jgi:hypothetical protein